MRAALAATLLFLLLAGTPTPAPSHPPSGTLADLAFMAGCWRGPSGEGATIEEYYTTPTDNLMLGVSRYTKGTRVTDYESHHRARGHRDRAHTAAFGPDRSLPAHPAGFHGSGMGESIARFPDAHRVAADRGTVSSPASKAPDVRASDRWSGGWALRPAVAEECSGAIDQLEDVGRERRGIERKLQYAVGGGGGSAPRALPETSATTR